MDNYKTKASEGLYFEKSFVNNLSCLQCAVTVNRYTQVCLLHVFLQGQTHTTAHLSYARLALNARQCSANMKEPQQQGEHTKAVNSNSTSISHTHKKQNLKPKKWHKIAQ